MRGLPVLQGAYRQAQYVAWQHSLLAIYAVANAFRGISTERMHSVHLASLPRREEAFWRGSAQEAVSIVCLV